MQIDWTNLALHDLVEMRAYIARERPEAAERQAFTVMDAARGLAQFPLSGRAGRVPSTRELVVPHTPFIVAYRVRVGAIDILRVLHGRQKWPGAL